MDTNGEFPFLTRAAFDQLISEFLSSRKPSHILKNPNNTSNGNANVQFWAKNNFYLHNIGTSQNSIIQLIEKQKKKSDHICNSVSISQNNVSESIKTFNNSAIPEDRLSIIPSSQFLIPLSNIIENDHTIQNAKISNVQIIPEHGSMADNQYQIKEKALNYCENLELVILSNFIPNKRHQFHALQDMSNDPTYQHNSYHQVANKNLEDYFGDLVKIQIAKIDHGPSDYCVLSCKIFTVLPNNRYHIIYRFGVLKNAFPAGGVVPLGPKEFSELDNLLINKQLVSSRL
ncbi:16666_t:CDS:2 [Gigaspora margarita]|uniref:16666_t:CDS:1 n=1 Tax=Gigaspora margarita TaxID=4874 RepID=A0ABM8W3V9_GIGMA|nr:16666_t:CDS:2 [Gigaspora margarita]